MADVPGCCSVPFPQGCLLFSLHGAHAAADDGLQLRFKFPQVIRRGFPERGVPVDAARSVDVPHALGSAPEQNLAGHQGMGRRYLIHGYMGFTQQRGGAAAPASSAGCSAWGSGSGCLI